jgi:hypothetical protein
MVSVIMKLVYFNADQIFFFYISQVLEKKLEYNEAIHQLFIDFKEADDSVRREVLYSMFIELGEPMKLVWLIKLCLNKTCSRVRISKYLSSNFHVQNGPK